MRRRGFTLPELLVAAAIGSLVLGLSIQGFSAIVKAIAASRSRFEATQHANTGIARLGDTLRRSHVFFYSARPLKAQPPGRVFTGRTGEHAEREALPDLLKDLGSVGLTFHPPAQNLRDQVEQWRRAGTTSKHNYRFTFDSADLSGGGDPTYQLWVAPGKRRGDPLLDRFPGPLAFFAVADFKRLKSNEKANPYALLPRTWTFYILYVAPMYLSPNDANIASPNDPRDHLPPPVVDNKPARTAIPYELRLVTIPDICAGSPTTPTGYNATTADGTLAPNPASYDPVVRRVLAPGSTTGNERFLEPPFDYDGKNPNGLANFDPVPIPMRDPPAGMFNPDSTQTLFRYILADGTRTGRAPSGPRIRGGGLHANFGMVGNDPPTADVFDNRLGPLSADGTREDPPRPITDALVMPYVDPDSADGTCVRFVNNLIEPPNTRDGANRLTLEGGKLYQRFVETIGPECPYFENRAQSLTGVAGASTDVGASGIRPTRLLLSVATRYRSRRDVPFAFANVQSEIPLDGVDQFAKLRPLL